MAGRSVRKRVDPSKVTQDVASEALSSRASGIRCASGLCPASVRSCSEVPGATLCGKLQARSGMEYATVAHEGLHLF